MIQSTWSSECLPTKLTKDSMSKRSNSFYRVESSQLHRLWISTITYLIESDRTKGKVNHGEIRTKSIKADELPLYILSDLLMTQPARRLTTRINNKIKIIGCYCSNQFWFYNVKSTSHRQNQINSVDHTL